MTLRTKNVIHKDMDSITPPSTPPRSPVCPSAPKKQKTKCPGCQNLLNGFGGENQLEHIGENGCLEE